ncbi:MAG: glucose-6-phosphate isomerase, partial [Chlorobiales bacterium]|nr:glucose-6-phosphate isomerase [Chlorobiales bacterium]
MDLSRSAEWSALVSHYHDLQKVRMTELFDGDPDRFARFSISLKGMLVDYSKNRIIPRTMELLMELARSSGVEERRAQMFAG